MEMKFYDQSSQTFPRGRLHELTNKQALIVLEHDLSTRKEIDRLQMVEGLLKQEGKVIMKMALIEPVVKEVPALRVICKRDKGSYGETISRLIGELCGNPIPAGESAQHG